MSTCAIMGAPVGAEFSGPVRHLTLERVLAFSGGPFAQPHWPDRNLHTDAEKAREAGLAGIIVSGTQFEGHLVDLLVELFGEAWFTAGTIEIKIPISLMLGENNSDLVRARFLAVSSYCHYRLGDLGPALAACEQGLQLIKDGLSSDAPHDELVWLNGLIHLAGGDRRGAEAALAQLRKMLDASAITARNYKPAYKYYLHLLARINAEEGKRDEALRAIKDLEWVKYKFGYWNASYDYAFMMDGVGQIYEKIGSAPDAERSYRDALSYNPQFALAHFHLAGLLVHSGRSVDAREEFKRFLSLWSTADANTPEVIAAGQMVSTLSPH